MSLRMVIQSATLGEQIAIVSDDDLRQEVEPNIIAYTEAEMANLVRLKPSDAQLRSIHLIKKIFPGTKVIS